MKINTKVLSINLLTVVILLVVVELTLKFTFSHIQTQGLDSELVMDECFGSSSCLKPLASGIAFDRLVNIDKNGFRKTGNTPDKKKRSKLILGDSVTMGVGVEDEECFASIITETLTSYNILNPSTIGWGTLDYLNYVNANREQLLEWQVDEVIVSYCLNDVYSGSPPTTSKGLNLKKRFKNITGVLKDNYRTYIWMKGLFFDRPQAYFEHDQQFYAEDSEDWRNSLDQLKEISNILIRDSIALTVVINPYEFQLRSSDETEWHPQEMIMESLIMEQVNCFVLGSGIDENSKDLYLYADGIHYSVKGHETIARELAQILTN